MSGAPLLIGTAAFVASAGAVEYLVRRLRAQPISSGLTGPRHLVLDAGFAGLAGGLAWTALADLAGAAAMVALATAGAVAGAAASDTLHRLFDRLSGGRHREIHLACAAVAFVGAAVLEALVARALGSWVLWALFSLYLCSAGFTYWCWPKDTPLQEKVATAAICVYFFAWGGLLT